MPLEDLTGNKYIDSLNETWPLGTDLPDSGDDHLRGIKNVLKKTFPNVAGPITLSDTTINTGAVPAGSVMLFYQAAAPTGWVRTAGIAATNLLRVVASATAGGTSGGSDDPVLNNKVPSHTHVVSANTGINNVGHTHVAAGVTGGYSADHSHTGATGVDGAHAHNVAMNVGSVGGSPSAGLMTAQAMAYEPSSTRVVVTQGAHQHSVTTGGASNNHTHVFSVTTSGQSANHLHGFTATSAANVGAANWTPRYLDVIICTKS